MAAARASLPRWIPKTGLAGRAVAPQWAASLNIRPDVMDPKTDIGLPELYRMMRKSNAVRGAIMTRRDHIFINGVEWKPKFSKKCLDCGYEHEPDARPDHCENCGKLNLISPDVKQRQVADRFFRKVDANGTPFLRAMKMHHVHAAVADNSYTVARLDYDLFDDDGADPKTGEVHKRGDIKSAKLVELLVANPMTFRRIQDPITNLPGGKFWICINGDHRPDFRIDPETRTPIRTGGTAYQAPGDCPSCGLPLHDVWYISIEPGTRDVPLAYFLPQEVHHHAEFALGYDLGYPPMESIFNLADVTVSMERFMKAYYDEMRMPRSAGFVYTQNPDGVQQAFKDAEDKNVAQRGQHFPIFTVVPSPNGPNIPIHVMELSKPPAEMQFLEFMDFCYRRIGAAFGVMPVFAGDNSASGLQNQGPVQWEVTAEAARIWQNVYNEDVFPWILNHLHVSDWELRLKEPREKDELKKAQTWQAKATWAMTMLNLGFEITKFDPSTGDIQISLQPRLGGMGGFGPGGAPPPAPGAPATDGAGGPSDGTDYDIGAATL
jgi:rubrerythrin